MSNLHYTLKDQQGTKIASGDQLRFNIEVDLEHQTMRVEHGATSTVCDIAGGDTFTITFKRKQ